MTQEEGMRRFNEEFSEEEIRKLAGAPIATDARMEQGDKVYLKDEFLDYLCWFFDEVYDGKKIPVVFQNVCIEVQEAPLRLKYYISFFEEHEDWFLIDVFVENQWMFKVVQLNRDMDPDDWNEKLGRYWTKTPVLYNNKGLAQYLPTEEFQKLVSSARNAFLYVYLYAYANMDNTEIVEVERMTRKEIAYEPRTSKKGNPGFRKVKRTIPYTRRVFKLDTPKPKAESRAREYLLSRWKVRGYTYTRKDGKVVNVKEHIANRHYPNKGVDKTQLGTDYYLKKPES